MCAALAQRAHVLDSSALEEITELLHQSLCAMLWASPTTRDARAASRKQIVHPSIPFCLVFSVQALPPQMCADAKCVPTTA